MPRGSVSAREAAYLSLIRCERDASYTNLEIDSKIKKYKLEGPERSLYTVLVYGVTELRLTLDYRIGACVTGDACRLDPEVKTLLRLGAYQILYLDRVPDPAAVNETVELARRFAPSGAHKLVNAALRALCRTKDTPPPPPDDPIAALEVAYAVPRGIIELWNGSYGEKETAEILDALLVRPSVTVRVNTLKTTADDLCAVLGGVTGEIPGAVVLDKKTPPEKLREALDRGLCFVQDGSSQAAVAMVDPRPGDVLVDVCSCPGGKSFAAAMLMEGKGDIRAFDLHENKLSLVTATAAKLGIEIISVCARDARDPDPDLLGKADRVICDVPCSGLGVIAKKPEIRYRELDSISRLPELQYEILRASAGYLKPGGRLLYSTCTLNRAENEEVVGRFLSNNADFTPVASRTFFPSETNDGFFAAVLAKLAN